DARAGIKRRNPFAQLDRPVRLTVAERLVEDGLQVESHRRQLAQRQRTDAALAQVEVDDVLPRRLHALHGERFDAHLVSVLSRAGRRWHEDHDASKITKKAK